MRGWKRWMCGVGLAAMIAAPSLCAQNSAGRAGAPVADQFVSAPGRMVTMPGQRVIPPGKAVVAPGLSLSPVPGVIAPFHSPVSEQPQPFEEQLQPGEAQYPGVVPARRHRNRPKYRPEYGVSGYGLPRYGLAEQYAASGDDEPRTGSAHTEGRSLTARSIAASPETSSPVSAPPAPSGNRPPYLGEQSPGPEAPSAAPNGVRRREPVLTVVMKDGKRHKVRNYALTPRTLIDLDDAAAGGEVDIPLSRINLAATKKAAARAGLSFAVPTS